MHWDAVLRRYFPAIIALLIASAAYFQASGMARLMGSALRLEGPLGSPIARSYAALPRDPWAEEGHATSADAILARNPFDSITGPLSEAEPPPPGPDPAAIVAGADPYLDPPCGAARVVLISASEDPDWSFAAIAGAGAGERPLLRRQGDEAAGYQVHAIARDRVWLIGKGARCQLALGAAPGASGPPPPSGQGDAPRPPRPGSLSPDIAAKINKIGENEYAVDRSVIQSVMERQAELLGRVRAVPQREGDRTVGLRVTGIKKDSLLGSLGLENGDQVQRINGFEVADPRSAMEAYPRLMAADRLTVSVVRGGKPVNIDLQIR